MKKIYALTFLVAAFGFLWSCGSVDSLQTFSFQYTINFEDERINDKVPDFSIDETNLNEYSEYRDNKDKISKSEILHFNFWVDSLVYDKYGTQIAFDPIENVDEKKITFDYVRFWITFDQEEYFELATFEDVDIKEYYRNPFHIDEVPEKTREKVIDKLKNNPIFYTKSEFSIINIENTDLATKYDTLVVPYFKYKTDCVLRFEVDL